MRVENLQSYLNWFIYLQRVKKYDDVFFVVLIIWTKALWSAISGDAVTAFTCALSGNFLIFAELPAELKNLE